MAIVIAGCDVILGADAREAVAARREQLDEVLRGYGASNPRLFGSVARGDATAASDIDVLVDLDPAGGNPSIAGLRNVVVHENFRIDPELISDIVDNHLAQLAAAIEG